jgi:hypothetical protein
MAPHRGLGPRHPAGIERPQVGMARKHGTGNAKERQCPGRDGEKEKLCPQHVQGGLQKLLQTIQPMTRNWIIFGGAKALFQFPAALCVNWQFSWNKIRVIPHRPIKKLEPGE